MRKHIGQKGFTLIEVVVATAIFVVVMLVSAGALISLLEANRKAQSQKEIINNVHFALDSMARSIRTGTVYHCGDDSQRVYTEWQDCPSGSGYMAHLNSDGNTIVYRRNSTDDTIELSTDLGSTWGPLTAHDIVITNLEFLVTGADSTDQVQPSVVIVLRGRAGNQDETDSEFNIQTFVSQRIID